MADGEDLSIRDDIVLGRNALGKGLPGGIGGGLPEPDKVINITNKFEHPFAHYRVHETNKYKNPQNRYVYWIYLTINEYFENFAPIKLLIQLIINFGKNLEDKAIVNVPLEGSYSSTRMEILRLPWNNKTWEKLDKTKNPYLLIMRKQIDFFQPEIDEFILLHFPEEMSDPAQYVEVLDEIAREIKAGRDIFKWRDREARKEIASEILQRLFDAIDFKIGAFGFSIDIKMLLTDK